MCQKRRKLFLIFVFEYFYFEMKSFISKKNLKNQPKMCKIFNTDPTTQKQIFFT